ncbi:MAG: NUDIX hydrolase [Acidimicrobiaceae bacterium]|nr:NUDIX hydrolase [Acidimicrobiaceae bacterium]
MSEFRKVSERHVAGGRVISFAVGTFESPEGQQFERELVRHPGAVVVVPLVGDDAVLLVRQFRAAVEQDLLELPAGKRDVPGEPTEVTAARELEEEVGRKAGRIELLGRFYNSPGFSDEFSWCYLARDLVEVDNDLQGVEEQYLTVEQVALDDINRMVVEGAILDGKTIIGLELALRHLGR